MFCGLSSSQAVTGSHPPQLLSGVILVTQGRRSSSILPSITLPRPLSCRYLFVFACPIICISAAPVSARSGSASCPPLPFSRLSRRDDCAGPLFRAHNRTERVNERISRVCALATLRAVNYARRVSASGRTL